MKLTRIFLFLLSCLFFQSSQAHIDKIPIDKFKQWKEVQELVASNQLKQALQKNTEIIKELDEEEKDKYLFGKTVNFFLNYNLQNYQKAFNQLDESFDKSLDSKFFKLMSLKKFYDDQFYNISQNKTPYNRTNINTWKLEHFHHVFKASTVELGNKIRGNINFRNPFLQWLKKGDYPFEIKSSLAELVSYDLVHILTDRRIYNVIDEINLNKELERAITLPGKRKYHNIVIADHPVKIAAKILSNLEFGLWKEDKLAPMLEVRSEFFLFMINQITDKDQKKKLLGSYKLFLRDLNIEPWWSSGMAQLIEHYINFQKGKVSSDILDLLKNCIETFPDSVGAIKCKKIRNGLERRSIQLKVSEFFDFNQIPLEFEVKNIKNIYYRLVPFDEIQLRLKKQNDSSFFRKEEVISYLNHKTKKDFKIKVEDYKVYEKQIVSDKLKDISPGKYIIFVSDNEEFKGDEGYLSYKIIQNTSVFPIISSHDNNILFRVLDKNSKKIKDFTVEILDGLKNKFKGIKRLKSNKKGTISLSNNLLRKSQYLVVYNKGFKLLLNSSFLKRYSKSGTKDLKNIFISQNKIYKPREVVKFKLISRKRSGFRYIENDQGKVKLEVKDSSRRVIFEKELDLDIFGQVVSEFKLPKDIVLGKINVFINKKFVNHIQVEEYKKPNYEIKLSQKVLEFGKDNIIDLKLLDYQGNKVDGVDLDITLKQKVYNFDRIPFPSFSMPRIEKEKIILNQKIKSNQSFTINKKLINTSSFSSFELIVEGSYNSEAINFSENLLIAKGYGLPKITVLSEPFGGNLELKISHEDPISSKNYSNKGKVLIYTLSNNKLGKLFKFYDTKDDQSNLKIKGLPAGGYRAFYEIKFKGKKLTDKVDFITYFDGKSSPVKFKVSVSKTDLQSGDRLEVYTGTNIKNSYVNVEFIQNGKILKDLRNSGAKVTKFKIPKNWEGPIKVIGYLYQQGTLSSFATEILVKKDVDIGLVRLDIPKQIFAGEHLSLGLKFKKKKNLQKLQVFSFAYDKRLDYFIENNIDIPNFFLKETNFLHKFDLKRNINVINYWNNSSFEIPYFKRANLSFFRKYGVGGPGLQKKSGMFEMETGMAISSAQTLSPQVSNKSKSFNIEKHIGFFDNQTIKPKVNSKLTYKLPKFDSNWVVYTILISKGKMVQKFKNTVSVIEKLSVVENNAKQFSSKDRHTFKYAVRNNQTVPVEVKVAFKINSKNIKNQVLKLKSKEEKVIEFSFSMLKAILGKNVIDLDFLIKDKSIKKYTNEFKVKSFQQNTKRILYIPAGKTLNLEKATGTIKIHGVERNAIKKISQMIISLIEKKQNNSIQLAKKIKSLEGLINIIKSKNYLLTKFSQKQELEIIDIFGRKQIVKIPSLRNLQDIFSMLKKELTLYQESDGAYKWIKGGESDLILSLKVFNILGNVSDVEKKYILKQLNNEKYNCIQKLECINSAIDLISVIEHKTLKKLIGKTDLSVIQKLKIALYVSSKYEDDVEDWPEDILDSATVDEVFGMNWADEKYKWKYYEDNLSGHVLLEIVLKKYDEESISLSKWISNQVHAKNKFTLEEILLLSQSSFFAGKPNHTKSNDMKLMVNEENIVLGMEGREFNNEKIEILNPNKFLIGIEVENTKGRENNKNELVSLKFNSKEFKTKIGSHLDLDLTIQSKIPLEFVTLYLPIVPGVQSSKNKSGYENLEGIRFYRQIFQDKHLLHFERLPAGTFNLKEKMKVVSEGLYHSNAAKLEVHTMNNASIEESGYLLNSN